LGSVEPSEPLNEGAQSYGCAYVPPACRIGLIQARVGKHGDPSDAVRPRTAPHPGRAAALHQTASPNVKVRAMVVQQGPPGQDKPATEAAAADGCKVELVQARPHRIG
jgi:hypothetical protein